MSREEAFSRLFKERLYAEKQKKTEASWGIQGQKQNQRLEKEQDLQKMAAVIPAPLVGAKGGRRLEKKVFSNTTYKLFVYWGKGI